jgi:adenylate cyclase class 2
MQEIEAKFYVQDLRKIELCLQELEAQLIQPRILERNIRFDLPDGRLRSEGRVLRLRQDSSAYLTYKSASQNQQGIWSRTEIEFGVEDFERANLFLEALGYHKTFIYEKFRTVYDLHTSEDSVHIMLDELPYGNFVEIEGTTPASISGAAEKLKLDWGTSVMRGYMDLFYETRHTRGLKFTDLTFENFDGLTTTPEELSVRAADL